MPADKTEALIIQVQWPIDPILLASYAIIMMSSTVTQSTDIIQALEQGTVSLRIKHTISAQRIF